MSEGAVLVTGGSGFVGMALAEALLEQGRQVMLFGTEPSPFADLLRHPRLSFVVGDVCSTASLACLASFKIDTVVNGAAITPEPLLSTAQARYVEAVNITGARNVMAFALAHRVERVFQLSSVSVYGEAETDGFGRFDEVDSRPAPDTHYGRTKLAAEQAMQSMSAGSETMLTCLRLGPAFGPWEAPRPSRTVASPHHQCLADSLAGRTSRLPRPLSADWFFSADLASTTAGLMTASNVPPILNLGAGRVTSLIEWCEALAQHSSSCRWSLDPDAPTVRVRHAKDRPPLSTARLDALLPDRPITSLEQAADRSRRFLERAYSSQTRSSLHDKAT